ncbi:hypothetical protein J2129_001059 [Methanofollis sp. W23]|uniref:hypothetical protein n=1 Tax=Methanofollis sp. W23 TaxID=2817849 RepID=UPI001AE1FF5F|nr:hypothetical protein [Methanofollis sp. W23]MBP2145605.1 hypothetical protein [Methanofollis sp. W23]
MHRRPAALLLAFALVAITHGAVLGEEVTLTGTAPAGETVYLFFTGPNLPAGGVDLVHLDAVATGEPETFTTVTAGDDGRWRYRWKTAGLGIDPGTYTVYASDRPAAHNDLGTSDATYSTLAVSLRRPGLVIDGPDETPKETPTTRVEETETPETPATTTPSPGLAAAAALALLIAKRRP